MKEVLTKLKKLSHKTHNKNFFNGLYFFLLIILVVNIYFSQNISSVFFGLTNYDRQSAVKFLQKIRSTKEFSQQLKYFENIYNLSLKNEVFSKEKQKEAMIKKFEQILLKNSQSRDILYSLFLLNDETGNKTKANKYLKKAKEIDPVIN